MSAPDYHEAVVPFRVSFHLARLNDLFSTNFEAGSTSPHATWVVVLKDDPTSKSNGWNYGYETEESSQIWIRRSFSLPPPSYQTRCKRIRTFSPMGAPSCSPLPELNIQSLPGGFGFGWTSPRQKSELT